MMLMNPPEGGSGVQGIPGANSGGFNLSSDSVIGGGRGYAAMPTTKTGLGSSPDNPFLAPFPTGQNTLSQTTPPATTDTGAGTGGLASFPANTGGMDFNALLSAVTGLNPATQLGGGNINVSDLAKQLQDAGIYPSSVGTALGDFLKSGAGYNPSVAAAMIAALQPQVARGQADIMEQFGSMGLRDSSPAAIGMGDYMSNVALSEGQILSGLYNNSVQNYMNVLTGMKMPEPQSGLLGDIASLLGGLGGGGGLAALIKALGGLFKKGGGGAGSGGGGGTGGASDSNILNDPALMTIGAIPGGDVAAGGPVPPPSSQDAGIVGGIDPAVLDSIFNTGLLGEVGNVYTTGGSINITDPSSGSSLQNWNFGSGPGSGGLDLSGLGFGDGGSLFQQ